MADVAGALDGSIPVTIIGCGQFVQEVRLRLPKPGFKDNARNWVCHARDFVSGQFREHVESSLRFSVEVNHGRTAA